MIYKKLMENAILDKINLNDGGEIDKGFIMPI